MTAAKSASKQSDLLPHADVVFAAKLAPAYFVVFVETATDMLQNELQLGPAYQNSEPSILSCPSS